MPKVSIVIPAFNAEKTIDNCINSLIYQTLADIEIIAVDDCSTDGTLEKLKSFERKHRRVKLLQTPSNLSAAVARKRGVEAATGKYIMFLDADDALTPTACEAAFQAIESRNVDIVQFCVKIHARGATEGQIVWFDKFVNKVSQKKITGNLLKKCFVEKSFGFTIWNKIYRSKLLKVAVSHFPNVPIYKAQDLLLQFYILLYAVSFEAIEDVLYEYSYGVGITGGSKFDRNKIDKHMSQSIVLEHIYEHLKITKLIENKQEVLRSITKMLIEDNLATVAKCIGTHLENYSKEKFLLHWGDGKNIHPKNSCDGLKKIFSSVFLGLSEDSIYKQLHKRVSPDSITKAYASLLEPLKKRLSQNSSNVIPVVMAVNENYAPYLSVAIQSIISNNRSSVYLYVFYTELYQDTISRLKALECQGICIEFVDVSPFIDQEILYSRAHYSIEMYYRLVIAEIFYFVPKVLYLDCDIVVLSDLYELYKIDVNEYVIGAARNPIHKGMFDYLSNKLKFDYKKYFNSGVLLINTAKFVEKKIKEKCLEFIKYNKELACPDQDALNIACDGLVKFFDQTWNFQWHHMIRIDGRPFVTPLIEDELDEYNAASRCIKILHYTSCVKPWNSPVQDLAVHFWTYAKNSEFFFDILNKNIALDREK